MSSMTLEESLERAQTAFRMGEYSLSKRLLERLLEKEKENPVIYNLLGSICEREGKYEDAIGLFQRAIELRHDNIEAYNNLGVAFKNKGDVENALSTFMSVLKLNSRRADVYYNLGNLYKDINLHKNAVEYYKKAIEKDPTYLLAYNNLGTVLEKLGKYDAALQIYHKGLQVDVNNARLHYNAGVILKKKNRLKEAEAEFKLALKNQPGFIAAKNNLALILQERREYERALALFKDILKSDANNVEVHNNIGVILGEQNLFDSARAHYEAALQINPHYKKARFNLALLAEETGAHDEALRQLTILLDHDPEHREARLHAGNILLAQGKHGQAEAQVKKILAADPRHLEALRSLGRIHLAQHDISQALSVKAEIQKIDPHDFNFDLDLAFYYKDQKDYKRAEDETRKFLSRQPQHLQASVMLADLLRVQKKHDAAVKVLLDIEKSGKREPEVLLLHAKVLKEQGRQEEAIELFSEIISAQGSSSEVKEIKNLGATLKLYEDTINEYEERFKDEWDKNLQLYKEITSAPAKENIVAGDAFLFEKALPVEEDTLPIINIGGIEPVFEINEEEEVLKLEEKDEIIDTEKDKIIAIEEQGAPTLMSLLEGEDLYEESPQRGRQRSAPRKPREQRQRPREAYAEGEEFEDYEGPEAYTLPPVEESPKKQDKSERKIKSEVDKKSLDALSDRLTGTVESLGEVLKNAMLSNALLTEQLKQRAQVPPIVMFTQPPLTKNDEQEAASIIPSLGGKSEEESIEEQAEGMPRYLADEDLSETQSIEADENMGIESPDEESPPLSESAEETSGLEVEESGEPPADNEKIVQEDEEDEVLIEIEPEDVTGVGEAGVQDKNDDNQNLRNELKSYVGKVRHNLDTRPFEEEAPPALKQPRRLLDYLANIANYLPRETHFNSIENDMRIKVESLRNKLSGKKGLFEHIERYFKPVTTPGANGITQESLLSTFTFIKDLSSHVPDKKMSMLMRERIDAILKKLRGVSGE